MPFSRKFPAVRSPDSEDAAAAELPSGDSKETGVTPASLACEATAFAAAARSAGFHSCVPASCVRAEPVSPGCDDLLELARIVGTAVRGGAAP
jgi:hypothetical protein